MKSHANFLKEDKKLFMVLKAKYFKGTLIEILTPKQMLQRLQITLAQVKAGYTFENLINGICQIIIFVSSKRKY